MERQSRVEDSLASFIKWTVTWGVTRQAYIAGADSGKKRDTCHGIGAMRSLQRKGLHELKSNKEEWNCVWQDEEEEETGGKIENRLATYFYDCGIQIRPAAFAANTRNERTVKIS